MGDGYQQPELPKPAKSQAKFAALTTPSINNDLDLRVIIFPFLALFIINCIILMIFVRTARQINTYLKQARRDCCAGLKLSAVDY